LRERSRADIGGRERTTAGEAFLMMRVAFPVYAGISAMPPDALLIRRLKVRFLPGASPKR